MCAKPGTGELKGLLSTSEAARLLDVDERTLRKWIRSGQIRATRVHPGMRRSPYRVPVSEVDRILAERQRELGEA